MRRYLLDTTPLAALAGDRPAIRELALPWMHAHEAATSIRVYGEVLEGLQSRTNYERRHAQLLTLLREVQPYFITHAVMQQYAALPGSCARHMAPA